MSQKKILNITATALLQFSKISKENSTKSIFFYIKGGGCNGFTYKLKPTNELPQKIDEVICLKNDIKNLPNKIDTPLENIQVCGYSLIHLLGTKIDWKKDIMGESFHFENPMASANCGCGTSFSTK